MLALLLLAFLVVLLRTAWVCDDAYISFRTAENIVNGYGPRWNVAERVQAYTNPLWMLVVAAAGAITREFFLTSIFLSVAVSLAAAVVMAFKVARSAGAGALAVALLIASKAFVDFSTSGLENPLAHLLLAAFAALYLGGKPGERWVLLLSLLASLAIVNRMDNALLYAAPLVHAVLRVRSPRAFALAAAGMLPLVLWELFSLVYYGFLFPNTAYAKLNTDYGKTELLGQGLHYLRNSLGHDPLTLVTIATAALVAVYRRSAHSLCLAAGMVLYVLYVVRVGGDFMSGRFLTTPFACAVVLIAHGGPRRPLLALPVVIVLGACAQPPSFLTGGSFGEDISRPDDRGVSDERRFYYARLGLLRAGRRFDAPNFEWVERGVELRAEAPTVAVCRTIGFTGFYAGPEVHIIDRAGLADPLLARMPAEYAPDWRIGHYWRALPEGYEAAVGPERKPLIDPGLQQLHEGVQAIVRGPLFTRERWSAILGMMRGDYDDLVDVDRYRYPDIRQAELEGDAERGWHWSSGEDTLVKHSGLALTSDELIRAAEVVVVLSRGGLAAVEFASGDRRYELRVDAMERADDGGDAAYRCPVPEEVRRRGFSALRIFPPSPPKLATQRVHHEPAHVRRVSIERAP